MKTFLVVFLTSLSFSLSAQFNNEWIDFSKTYYKFKVGKDGLYRINQSTLQNAGLGTAQAQNFQLWRNGVQVPIFTSLSSGVFSSTDYIEFWGKANDGAMDNKLYNNPTHQLNRKWSLVNDTASYFLTINTNTVQNLRLVNTTNNVAGNVLPAQQNFMYKTGFYPKNIIHPGFAAVVGEYLHASSYDAGEGWSTNDIGPSSPFATPSLTNLFADVTSSTQASFVFSAAGNAPNARNVDVKINGVTVLTNPSLDYFNTGTFTASFSVSTLSSGVANIVTTNSSAPNDRMVIAYQEITYPRLFNFGNEQNFEFELAANPAGNYLEINNFNAASTIPILYDLTNGRRYVAVVNGAQFRFALLPSTVTRNMVLVNQASSNITNISALQTRVFTNLLQSSFQGDYLILTSRILHTNTTPANVIEKYKAYRNSPAGGGFNVKIIDVEDLYDQYSFGIDKHPIALRNYLRQTRSQFAIAPKFILIIGRGTIYNEARIYNNQPYLDVLNMVPTFGWPASDNLLTAEVGTFIQTTPIGRLGAINEAEVDAYLNKLKEYEQKQADMNFTIANKAWMLNGTFVTGSSEPFLQGILDAHNTDYMNLWKDTFIGGAANLFTKTTAGGVVPLTNTFMEQIWNQGHSLLEYFGHSSATALEFNLEDPFTYNNVGKYPMMIINGCNAGNYFIYNPFRITSNTNQSLSEKFVFAPSRGSIGFIASTSFGVVNYLDYYNKPFFRNASISQYGKSIGEIMRSASQNMFTLTGTSDFYARMHSEQTLLQGDPALKLNVSYPKPDYVVEDQTVVINPSFVSIAESNFNVKLMYMDLGKAINDSFNIRLQRQYPNGQTQTIFNSRVKAAYYADSITFVVPIDPARDKGLNRITICLDADNEIDEMSELNNCITKDVFIFEDEAKPIHPYNYAIVNTVPLKLIASTANPLSINRTYNMELDTTELFNSPVKMSQSITQVGGLIEFTPVNTLIANATYYWRVSVANTTPIRWNVSSFTYLPTETLGFNQGHLYQHLKSTYQNMRLDSSSRRFLYDSVGLNVSIRNAVWPWGNEESHYTISLNQDPFIRGLCELNSITINVFDPISGQPWVNNGGQYGSSGNFCTPGSIYNFTFLQQTLAQRNVINNFLRNIVPNGFYVTARNFNFFADPINASSNWLGDASANGGGVSMYNTLRNAGFTLIDNVNGNRAFAFAYRKNNASFIPKQVVGGDETERIVLNATFTLPFTTGYITSPAFGPAKQWQELHWRGSSLDAAPNNDSAWVNIIGIRNNGVEDSITTVNQTQQDFNIQNISAVTYPYLKLKMKNKDTVNATPWQLNYWRLNYIPVPEGAIAPNIQLNIKDTLDVGEPLNVQLAFKNISFAPFDSIKVRINVVGQNGVTTNYILPKQKPLAIGETLNINYPVPTANFGGINQIYVAFNPDNDQPEQFFFNNFLFKNFFVRPDRVNPLLDVTFDGVHILNKDIVSANPSILIKLKDESKFLALDDTAGLKIQLRFPGTQPGVFKSYNWGTDTLKFYPANLNNGDNTASAELKPRNLPDGEYELIVKGKDKNGNNTGEIEYKVLFTVISKPMISNLLNYPNPFTSSTAFVFTITGSEVPQNIKIEIMTITGKIVREITKAELGPIRVGKNITEFKWDGTDQYGSKLANGVYLYRVVTNLNGKSLEKYKVGGDDKTDQYFNKGYGKMVLIR